MQLISYYSVQDIILSHKCSSDGVFRESYSSVKASGGVPSIPVQPIGYGDAIYFMRYHCTCPCDVVVS